MKVIASARNMKKQQNAKEMKKRQKLQEAARQRDKDRNYGKHLPLVDPEKQTACAYHHASSFVCTLSDSSEVLPLSSDTQWQPSEYVVSENADGQRCFVLCNSEGHVWCLRPRKKVPKSIPLPVSVRYRSNLR